VSQVTEQWTGNWSWQELIVSAVTAGIVSGFGGVIVIVGSGNELNQTATILCVGLGLIAAAKDYRALKRMPPLEDCDPAAIPPTLKGGKTP